jgi:hypothetical protein
MAVHIWRKIHEFEEIEPEHVRTNDVILVHINVEFSADMTLLAYDLFAFGHGQHNHLLLKCAPGEQSITPRYRLACAFIFQSRPKPRGGSTLSS